MRANDDIEYVCDMVSSSTNWPIRVFDVSSTLLIVRIIFNMIFHLILLIHFPDKIISWPPTWTVCLFFDEKLKITEKSMRKKIQTTDRRWSHRARTQKRHSTRLTESHWRFQWRKTINRKVSNTIWIVLPGIRVLEFVFCFLLKWIIAGRQNVYFYASVFRRSKGGFCLCLILVLSLSLFLTHFVAVTFISLPLILRLIFVCFFVVLFIHFNFFECNFSAKNKYENKRKPNLSPAEFLFHIFFSLLFAQLNLNSNGQIEFNQTALEKYVCEWSINRHFFHYLLFQFIRLFFCARLFNDQTTKLTSIQHLIVGDVICLTDIFTRERIQSNWLLWTCRCGRMPQSDISFILSLLLFVRSFAHSSTRSLCVCS